MRLCFAGIRELLGGDDQPNSLVVLDQLVLALSLLLDVSKKSLDSSVSLERCAIKQRIKVEAFSIRCHRCESKLHTGRGKVKEGISR